MLFFLFFFCFCFFFFFFNDTATTEIYTLSLHDALPISPAASATRPGCWGWRHDPFGPGLARPYRDAPAAGPAGPPGAAARPAARPAPVPRGGTPAPGRPGSVGCRRLAGRVPAGGRADPRPLAVPARAAGRHDQPDRADPRAQLGASRRAAALAFSPALLGLGVGAGRGPGPVGRPVAVRRAVAVLAGVSRIRPRR